jgi:hypothetical protein
VSPACVIARLGGLPCDVMDGFSSRLGDRQDALARCAKEFDAARTALATCLHDHVPGAAPDRRGALLAVKRDCHNRRPLRRHRGTDAWALVAEAAGPLATRVLEAEAEHDTAKDAFAAAYHAEAARQGRHLAALLDDPLLRTGLAVASPLFADAAARLRSADPEDGGRRQRRLATTLLRYVSRGALKLSPFSTFTPVGLAHVVPGSASLTLTGSPWRAQSLVRVRRHVLDRCADLLQRYLPWRRRLVVALNDSAVQLPDGRVLLRRPSHYRADEEGRTLRYHEEALVRASLRGPLVESLRCLLSERIVTYGDVVPALRQRLDGGHTEADIALQLDRLVDIGFLELIAPWRSDDRHLEKAMVRELRRLAPDPGLEACVGSLERLVALEESLMGSSDPASDVREMDALIDRAIEGAARAGGVGTDIDVTGGASHEVYQDVWCAPTRPGQAAVVRLGRAPLDEAARSVAPLVGYARLWDRRLDFLYTLGALLRRARGGQCVVPLLEAFRLAQEPWQAFLEAHTRKRGDRGFERATWNPLGLPLLQELASWRDAAHAGLDTCLVDGPDGRRIQVEGLETALRRIPARFTESHAGGCLFLQPATADGSLWVLNRLKEGTGRFGSRYTPVMPPGVARSYAAGLRRRGSLEIEGEPVELLDVQCIQGDTLNVHLPQTPKVLTLPGATVGLPASQRRGLNDMVVTVDRDGCPQLRDAAGQRYLPVYLGVAYQAYLPTLVKFLCAFGPTEMGAVFPAPLERDRDGVVVRERTVIGNVVIHRRAWRVPAAPLRRALAAPDSDAFAAVHRWRRERGIPERVFAIERVPHPSLDHVYKPQYLDLTSPLFTFVLRAALETAGETLLLEEALPAPEAFPQDAQGRRWAVELLVDSLSLPASRDALPTDSRPAGTRALDDRAERLNDKEDVMDAMKPTNALDEIDGLEIEPLSDEALEQVAGGASKGPSCCSQNYCSITTETRS